MNTKASVETIQLALSDEAVLRCKHILRELYPHIPQEDDAFLFAIRKLQVEGYNLAYIEKEGIAASLVGFRVGENLAWGKYIFIDELATAKKYRHQGLASAIIDWLVDYAKTKKCSKIFLDFVMVDDRAKAWAKQKGFKEYSTRYAITL
ncbi:MAG: N-acetyltransferase GCN5 [Thermonema sp.]|jgi:GNAT superfamily N-acetyltransferase|uniref:GNAT family N-acetyltransferase n=1 Tax=Thermonema TaxID=28194 RepID=UPI0006897B25|nr:MULTISPECIES: GNAT family N-acetyltransferase [Thermonema]GIV40601.1 MAG: N-acetyltransferase GCN5 [Thermonema sp.]